MVNDCDLAAEFRLDRQFARHVALAINRTEEETGANVRPISGFRTDDEQRALIAEPDSRAAPVHLSNHTLCPARALDVSLGPFVPIEHKRVWGRNVTLFGLRWGGGSPIDADGIPTDWQHADMGPRPR